MLLALLLDEVRQHVGMQVVDLDHGDTEGEAEPLGKVGPHQQRAQQSGAAGEGDGIELIGANARATYRLADDGDDVLLVGTGGELGHNAAVGRMYGLRGDDIAQQLTAAQYGRRGVVAGALYT